MKVGSKVKVKERLSGIYPIYGFPVQLIEAIATGEIVTVSGFINPDGSEGCNETAGGITIEEDGGALHPLSGRPLGHAIDQFEEL